MPSRVALLFPPTTDPRAPRLPLPWLAATLRGAGVATSLHDLDILGLLALLRPQALRAAGEVVRRKARARAGDSIRRLARLSESIPERIEGAIGAFRDLGRFLDPHDRTASRDLMLDALDLVSAASPRPVRYSIETMGYDVEGVDPTRFADLVRVTGDPEANLFREFWETEVFPGLAREAPEVVGVSISVRQQLLPGLMLARSLRARGHFVVIGGNLFTRFAGRLAELPEFFDVFADAVVVYEGETAILELLARREGGRDLAGVPNLLSRDGRRVRVGPCHVEDVERLPTPDFDGMPLDQYLTPVRVLPLLTGKGCYWDRCRFCDIPFANRVSRVRYRQRRTETVARDVRSLHERFGCRHFFIGDEAVLPGAMAGLAEALEPESPLGLSFGVYARFEPGFTPEVCRAMAGMGVRKIFFGLESASPDTLAHMDKGIDLAVVRRVLEGCEEAGIAVLVFSMIGFPEEDEASAERTIRFYEENADLLDRPASSVDVHLLEIQMRTPYAEEADRFGVVLPPGTLEADFVVGVGTRWEGRRGIPRPKLAEIYRDAGRRLDRTYRRWHSWPSVLWPQHEEWSVVYGEGYADRPFLPRVSLPEAGGRCRLRWNGAALVEREGGRSRVEGRRAAIELPEPLERALVEPRSRTAEEILALLAEPGVGPDREAQEEAITGLVRSGLLQIAPDA